MRDTLKQQPNNVDAAISLARVLLARKSPDQALEVLDNVLLAAPGDLRTLNAKGVVLDQKGRHQEAQGLYRKALEREPSNAMLHNNLKLSLALESKTETEDAGSQPRMDDALARSEQ
nr:MULTISPECIES: tetratricopeptide repeat protein [Bradyrhizobium]